MGTKGEFPIASLTLLPLDLHRVFPPNILKDGEVVLACFEKHSKDSVELAGLCMLYFTLSYLKIMRQARSSQKLLATIVYRIVQVFVKIVVTFCC